MSFRGYDVEPVPNYEKWSVGGGFGTAHRPFPTAHWRLYNSTDPFIIATGRRGQKSALQNIPTNNVFVNEHTETDNLKERKVPFFIIILLRILAKSRII